MEFREVAAFHGHECPGLAMGYRMALAGLEALSVFRSKDEEIVAIVENNACGVDALQCLSGCTFGKGNLIFKDYGKSVYTIFSRNTGKGVRVCFHGDGLKGKELSREERIGKILNAPTEDIIKVDFVEIPIPEKAEIRKSVLCSKCGESIMDTRAIERGGGYYCIPCSGQ